jgi:hypothetical protein
MKQAKQNASQEFHTRYITDNPILKGGTSGRNKQIDKRSKANDE